MNILFSGPNSFINEWLRECEGHSCFTALTIDDQPLHGNTQHYQPETEAVLDVIIDLHLDDAESRSERLDRLVEITSSEVLILVNSVFITLTELSQYYVNVNKICGVAYLPTLLKGKKVELSLPYGSDSGIAEKIRELFKSINKDIELVGDYPGMVFPRVLATIVNEAVFTLQQGVADEDAIDTAMKLGVNYPEGPLAWGRKLGYGHILRLLRIMHAEYGDDRYRPAPLLAKLAAH